MNALDRFNAGLAPPDWRREAAADGIAFVHDERGVRLEARSVDVEARAPGLDAARWELVCSRSMDGERKRESLGRVPDRESAIETLYKQMYSINSRAREADDTGADAALPSDAFDPNADADPRRDGDDRRWADPDDDRPEVDPADGARRSPNAEGR